ncbi:helix-turn-helix domain-containing protein [Halapricum desulfuricans]|uniref:Transcriptional regulator, contains HTH domain n=1 Tax=Halapricum desulfuricans TaxID=2841257 RepID=A0A897NHS8_9EURY|nr:helix-turn-helix domain-containing protein [Halapricum desulfuricans]QSG14000.1 Transcriptional regulator, contains HTH domain [Halapricum desulfuricans]
MAIHETSAATESGEQPGIRMTMSFADPATARELLLFLGRSLDDESFSVDCVVPSDSGPHVVAVDTVTDAQLSTAEYAVSCGYYDDPRSARLADIADEFDRSESAISQRLNAVERHLVRSFVDANDLPDKRAERC